jgi:CheY-specific phosphatase CheX
MSNSAEKILYRKAALIFEELGFLMPRPDGGRVSHNGTTRAMVSFKGPFSGCLLVSLSNEILSQLSANMLGDEQTPTELLKHDSLKEISNVICGNALPAIYGFEPIFHLDAPVIHEETDSINLEYSQAAHVHLSFDRGNAEIILFAESNAPEAFFN